MPYAVAASHRRAAIEHCSCLIMVLKQTVPIWKKEVHTDGDGWVES
jgi:molybdopterin synthase catalytic subunit